MKISVLTPSYNSEKFIEKAIKCVLDQNDENFEHIIVDGGSKDGTAEVLKRYPHLKWVSEKDNGQSDAMNKAFRLSSGDIIVYLNADDAFYPNAFKEVRKIFNESKSSIVVGKLDVFQLDTLKFVNSPEVDFRKILFPYKYEFPYNPVAYFYKREVQEEIGEFPLNNHFAMDYWFLLRAFHKFAVTKTEFVFGQFYNDDFNKTSTTLKDYCFKVGFDFCWRYQRDYVVSFLVEYFNFYRTKHARNPKEFWKVYLYNRFLTKKFTVKELQYLSLKKVISHCIKG